MTAEQQPILGDEPLVEGPVEARDERAPTRPPAALVAAALVASLRPGDRRTVLLTTGERRADELGRALSAMSDAATTEVLVLPPWDCLPYDRASPSREVQGRRLAVLSRLHQPADGLRRILVLSAEAAMQRVPPREAAMAAFELVAGETLDRDILAAFAARTGYVTDDRIDEPGEIAILGEVVDVYPPARSGPVRLTLDGDRIAAIRAFDPVTQRSEDPLDHIRLTGASELLLDPETSREAGDEHRLGETVGPLETIFDIAAADRIVAEPEARARRARFRAQVEDAHGSRRLFSEAGETPPPGPDLLYLTAREADDLAAKAETLEPAGETPPGFAREPRPGQALKTFLEDRRAQGRRIVLTGLEHELAAITRLLKRSGADAGEPVPSWAEALQAPPGAVVRLVADLDGGFDAPDRRLAVVTAVDVLGGRVAQGGSSVQGLIGEAELRVGDVVIHEDHGLGVLTGLERVEVDGAARDVIRLEYQGGATVLAPVEEFGRIWRYGSEPSAVSLDRLNSDGWTRRRAEVSAQIDALAAHLVDLARERTTAAAEPVRPPRAAYAEFSARFPFAESPDQSIAIEAVLADLASGRPMNRLVCGDVGFGKTEVALRAAAAVALAGRQVMLAAPTTVLARQHVETFRKRFEGTGVRVAHLSRLVDAAEARAVRADLASGAVGVVVGTHALGSEGVVFADLGLTIVDEEHRFGTRLKAALQSRAPHRLTMTATPIPRTLQSALVGIQDVSVIATPPARRRPVRTFLTDFDAASVRTALVREKRRGGQSFVVVPRIEDMEPMAETLRRLLPELGILSAHGQMPAAEVDDAMVGFAEGRGDVLLATNIIENGLDVPRANTIIVSRPELFGLAQLHQLRGRVGRGRTQGYAYLLTDPDSEIPEASRARIGVLEALDRLGAGFAVSARDLDLRGGGDLAGDEQAGHIRLVGSALYQSILERAILAARGEAAAHLIAPPRLDATAALPEAYIPDPTIRINLYVRLARVVSSEAAEALEDEIADRFGPPPPEAEALLADTRMAALAAEAGVTRIATGPKATAFTVDVRRRKDAESRAPGGEGRRWVEDRLVCDTRDGEPHGPAYIAAVLLELAA